MNAAVTLIRVFFEIALASIQIRSQSGLKGAQIKKKWADSILRILKLELEVSGVAPSQERQILVGNHISFLDIPVILSAFPEAIFVAKNEVRRWPIIGKGAAGADTIFVVRNRKENRSNARIEILKALQERNARVVVFPAGTSTLYETVAWKKGIFEIAREANVMVQLFRLDYTPLRECAYIDDDLLVPQIAKLSQTPKKVARLKWLQSFKEINEPMQFAEDLRKMVTSTNEVTAHEV